MKGTMLVMIAADGNVIRTDLDAPPDLATLQTTVGGYLEKVPHFNSIEYQGAVRRCVALCNEEGKLDRPSPLPRNLLADQYWAQAMQRDYGVRNPMPDYLVGNIVILFGDPEFMESL